MIENWLGRASKTVRDPASVLLLSILTSLVSIFASGILGVLALALWLLDCLRQRRLILVKPPFITPVLVYFVGVMISMALSSDPLTSAINLKKLLLFCYTFLMLNYFEPRHVRATVKWFFIILVSSALLGAFQYFFWMEIDWLNRITGFMSHWMTFAGQLMMGIVALAAYVVFGDGPDVRLRSGRTLISILALGMMAGALTLSLTRNAWLGTLAGLFVLITVFGVTRPPQSNLFDKGPLRWLHAVRWNAAAVAILLIFLVLLPTGFQSRIRASFDPEDTTTKGRLELLRTGANIIREHPLVGIGPRMVRSHYLEFRESDEFPEWMYQHLHNNLVQIAAESGLPTLFAWLAIWILAAKQLIGLAVRAKGDRFQFFLSVNGLAAIVAFQVAGLFEYNFGDSEILILLLFFVTAPYVVQRDRARKTA